MLFLSALGSVFAASPVARPQLRAEPQGRTIHPHALAVNPATHHLYAVDQERNRLVVMDGNGVVSFLQVGRQPNSIAVDAAANRLYVVNAGDGNVSVIDGSTDRVITTEPTDARPYAIAVNSALHQAYVTNTFSNKVTVIDGTTNRAAQLAIGSQDFVEADTQRGRIFFISYENPSLTMLDATGVAHAQDLQLAHPWGLAIDERRGIVYVTEIGADALVAWHEDDGTITRRATGSMPDAVAVDISSNTIYVTNYAANTVSVFDGASLTPLANVPVGERPQAVAIDEQRHLVFVANTHANSVTVIDGNTHRVLGTIPAGANPYAIAVDSDRGNVYVANYGPHPVTKLDLSSIHH